MHYPHITNFSSSHKLYHPYFTYEQNIYNNYTLLNFSNINHIRERNLM